MENSNIDIFKDGEEVQAGWAAFKNVGDKVQGTYIDKFEQRSKFNQDQIVYVLKNGQSLINVGFNKSKVRLHQKFDALSLGQIVGIEFIGTKDSAEGGNPQKVYKIVANPEIVDKEWLEANELSKSKVYNSGEGEGEALEEGSSTTPALTPSNDEALVEKIAELAVMKLGVKTKAEINDKVMEATGIPVLSKNYKEIIAKLEEI